MRKNTVVNHENEDLMNEILRQMSTIYGHTMNPYMVAKFVGVLLVLKKHGALEHIDYNTKYDDNHREDDDDIIITDSKLTGCYESLYNSAYIQQLDFEFEIQ